MASIRETAIRICRERGLNPSSATIDPWPTVNRSDFHRNQIDRAIESRFDARLGAATATNLHVQQWIKAHIANPKRHTSLIIYGNTGVGKTHQAIGIVRAIGHHKATQHSGLNWSLVEHHALNMQLRPHADHSNEWAIDRYLGAELLILDDIGTEQTTDYILDNLLNIINHRWSKGLATIYTTNLEENQISIRLGARIASRLSAAASIVLDGPDWRLGQS